MDNKKKILLMGGGSSGIWTPADSWRTIAWWDAVDPTYLTIVSDKVSLWAEKIYGKFVYQNNAAIRPDYTGVNINGVQAVGFTDDALQSNLIAPLIGLPKGAARRGLYCAYQPTDVGLSINTIALQGLNGTSTQFGIEARTGSDPHFRGGTDDIVSGLSISTDPKVADVVWAGGTDGYIDLTKNGAVVGSDDKSLNTSDILVFSNDGAAKVTDVIFTDGLESLAERQKFQGYLAWKIGIEDDLPVDHPYRGAPPRA